MYVQKSDLFKKSYFVIGTDILEGIFNPEYYGNKTIEDRDEALNMITITNGCKFIVGGRKKQVKGEGTVVDSPFEIMNDIIKGAKQTITGIPHLEKYIELSEEEFHIDMSSSEARKAAN